MDRKVEKEVKFLVSDLLSIENRIRSLGGVVVQERVYEKNLRLDTPDRKLSLARQVLRLRQDKRIRLTYKGPADPASAISERPEHEIVISNLEQGQRILESLGYEVITIYEKYRASYMLTNCEISLDEMPYGNFIEIEGPEKTAIKKTADCLGINWGCRSSLSYLRLFAQVKDKLSISMRDLSFDNFANLKITPAHLDLRFADEN